MNNSTTLAGFLNGYEKLSRFAFSISLAASGICCAASYLLFGSIPFACFIIPFAATQLVYNLDRFAEHTEADQLSNPERTAFVQKYRKVYIFLLAFSLLVLVVSALSYGLEVLATALFFPISAVLYVLPILPFKKIRRVKEIPGFKTVYVPLCWAVLIFLAMVIQQRPFVWYWAVFFFLFVFIRLFVGGFLGDIRDLKGDEATGVKTMAVLMGKKSSLIFLEAMHLLSVLLIPFFILVYNLPFYTAGLGFSALIGYTFHRRIVQDNYRSSVYYDLFDLEYHSYPFVLWGMDQLL